MYHTGGFDMKQKDFSYYVMRYLKHYLPHEKGLSKNTIESYRSCFVLLLMFCTNCKGISIETLCLEDLSIETTIDFLHWLEITRKCSTSTRKQRHAAICSFFKYVSTQKPSYFFNASRFYRFRSKKVQSHAFKS